MVHRCRDWELYSQSVERRETRAIGTKECQTVERIPEPEIETSGHSQERNEGRNTARQVHAAPIDESPICQHEGSLQWPDIEKEKSHSERDEQRQREGDSPN